MQFSDFIFSAIVLSSGWRQSPVTDCNPVLECYCPPRIAIKFLATIANW